MEALATRDTEVERLQHEMGRLAANRDEVCWDKLELTLHNTTAQHIVCCRDICVSSNKF